VIGPEVRAARERAGLDVEELSGRTRIRPHVLEAIEVDDFGPCGGDFYARGHLRTLARYLGLDGDTMVATYDERYAHAPINARRVFEAELGGGLTGGMRATSGGPRWSMLAAAVLALLMVWGVARFFTEPAPQIAAPSPHVADSAGLAANRQPITSPLTRTSTLTVLSLGGPSTVTVRDRHGDVVWAGRLHRGARHEVAGVKPFTVLTDNGAATRVRLGERWLGPVGTTDAPALRTVG
jgi:cytoskeletal protein RodZ